MNGLRRLFGGCLVTIVLVLLCTGVSTFALDRICANTLPRRLPIYPGATVLSEQHSFFTSFGMGSTVLVLYSPDDPSTVRAWYGRSQGAYLRRGLQGQEFGYNLSAGEFDVTRAEDGVGSQIILHGECGVA